MNRCPHCQVVASPLRLVGDPPYVCPKCGGHSKNAEALTAILNVAVCFICAAAGGLEYEYVEFLRNSTFWLIVVFLATFVLSLILLRWVFGRLVPVPKED